MVLHAHSASRSGATHDPSPRSGLASELPAIEPPALHDGSEARWGWDELFRSLYHLVAAYFEERGKPADPEERHRRARQVAAATCAKLRYRHTDEELAAAGGRSVKTIERFWADLRAAFMRTEGQLPAPRPIPRGGAR